MLRKLRITLALICFSAITLLLLDLSGTLHAWLGWLAKIQFLPAVMAVNAAVIAGILILTLLLGRIYCSVLCPLGVFQDGVSWLSARRKGKKARFGWLPEKKWLRYGILVLVIGALVAGLQPLVALVAPYSAYGRMVQSLLSPVWTGLNNVMAAVAEHYGSYAFYSREVWLRSLPTFCVAAATFVLIVILAWRNGRSWCSDVCPVGTVLGCVSRFSMMRPVIDADKCRNCHACEKKCKASCIDIASHRIDHSRCVDCFDCLDSCKFDALHYRFTWRKPAATPAASGMAPDSKAGQQTAAERSGETRDEAFSPCSAKSGVSPDQTGTTLDAGRRAFLAGTVLMAGTLAARAQEKKVDGGFADIIPKKAPRRSVPLTPAGSESVKDFYSRCTACQLCVAACPNNVLRPSASPARLMQPEMSYEKGWCRPECVRCAEVCPSGAIVKITREEKTSWKIGTAVVDYDLCLPSIQDMHCGNCATRCPSGAILMVPVDMSDPDSKRRVPIVNPNLCTGCGACEHLCPVRPLSAIRVDGLAEGHHRNQ